MKKQALFILVLIFASLLVFFPHYGYDYPLHVDEWQHLAQSRHLSETGEFSFLNPYFENESTPFTYEQGFHVFLSSFLEGGGLDPVTSYKYLPVLFMLLGCLAMFYLTFELFRNYWVSLLSMLFYATLKSNVNIYGPWFLVPLTFAIPFISVFLVTFLKGVKGDVRYLMVSGLIAVLLLLSHPISLTFLFPVLMIYFLFSKQPNKMFWSFLFFLLTIIGVFLINFTYGWGIVEINYFIPSFLGIGMTVMAIVGLIISMRKKKYLLPAWTIIVLIMIYVFVIFGISFLAPYQRLLYYLLISFIPLAALGTYYTMKHVHVLIGAALILVILFTSLNNYGELPSNVDLYYLISDEEYKLAKLIPENSLVVASSSLGTAINPVNRAKVYSIIHANLHDREGTENTEFFNDPCDSRIEFDYVLTDDEIDCDGIKLVQEEGTSKLYKNLN